MNVLTESEWRLREAEHRDRAKQWTTDHLARRRAGHKHPVFDFLFEYYPIRAAHLERWHPGYGTALADPQQEAKQATWKYYRRENGVVFADAQLFLRQRQKSLVFIKTLLEQTLTNPAHFDCFGLHEWAMVYRTTQPRHDLPLRLGASGTDRVVAENSLRCTHFDAFRFFTPAAVPLNFTVLDRDSQTHFEQKGCLHATMDLYKWATKLAPLVPGELWLDCFALAWDARILDMAASPYDCREYGISPVCIENSAGKQEYVHRQRELSQRGEKLRTQLLSTISPVLALNLN